MKKEEVEKAFSVINEIDFVNSEIDILRRSIDSPSGVRLTISIPSENNKEQRNRFDITNNHRLELTTEILHLVHGFLCGSRMVLEKKLEEM